MIVNKRGKLDKPAFVNINNLPVSRIIKQAGLLCLFIVLSGILPVSAQVQLERVSLSERADGKGFVLRYHLSEPVDSFEIAQYEAHRIQMILYNDSLLTSEYSAPVDRSVIESIRISGQDKETGFELTLHEEQSFIADAYLDVNLRDILLSLHHADSSEVASHVAAYQRFFTLDGENDKEPVDSVEFDEIEQNSEPNTEQGGSSSQDYLAANNPATLDRITPGDPMELYLRAVFPKDDLTPRSSFLLRPVNIHSYKAEASHTAHPWMEHSYFSRHKQAEGPFEWRLYSPVVYTSNNSAIPMGQNDGVLWQGRGNNYFMTGGAGVQAGPLTAVFRPQFAYSENLGFTVDEADVSIQPGFDVSMYPRFSDSEFQMYLTHADIPWRFGEESLSRFDLGDSFVQLEYEGFATGFSNERIWTGPAVHNSLIFSNHAPGFLHGFIGTNAPFSTSWGNLEARWLWGGVRESGYFDNNPSNDLRYVSALTFNYSPVLASGLSLGFTRAAYSYYEGLGISDLFLVFRSSQPSYDTDPEKAYFNMMSFFARWVFPSVNFEVYAEWGRNDHKRKTRDFFAEPELNRGYVLGFIKSFEITPSKRLLLNTEVTDLENSSVTATNRDFNIWYTNETISQGFTHRGQVLGAGIGPGSSTQQIHIHYYDRWGMAGISASRIAHHMDRHFKYEDYFRSLARWPEHYLLLDRHEIEIRYGFDLLLFLPYNFELQAGYKIGKIENRFNLRGVDINNYQYSFTLRYNLGGFNR